MNPIYDELKRIAPDYELTDDDIEQITQAENPSQVAAWLEQRLTDWRGDFAAAFGCDSDIIPIGYAIKASDLSLAVKRQSVSLGSMQAALGREASAELARLIGRAETRESEIVQVMREEFAAAGRAREPQADGIDYWTGELRAGVPLPVIRGHIRREEQAKAGGR